MIELVMVVVMLGVMAVFAAPRIFNSQDFYARGFHDETLALLRHAHKSAIAQRRTVCVVFSATAPQASLRIASNAASPTCDQNLSWPLGNGLASITAKTGVGYSTTPVNFNFNGLGQPVNVDGTGTAQATQELQVGNAAKAIKVEAVTGHVHEE